MRLSGKEFDALIAKKFPRFSEKTISALELVFVHGYRQRRACEITGVSKTLLNRRVANVREKVHEDTKCPRDWRLVRLCLPPDLEPELSILLRKIDQEIARLQGAKLLRSSAKKKHAHSLKRKKKRT